MKPGPKPFSREQWIASFFDKVTKSDACWKWNGAKSEFGYGIYKKFGKKQNLTAHRASWEIHNGKIPSGLCCLHRCDNPECCNPDHLFIGTHRDNRIDCLKKGRWHVDNSAERNPNSVLCWNDVITIRMLCKKMTQSELSWIYGVNQPQISRIVRGHHWR